MRDNTDADASELSLIIQAKTPQIGKYMIGMSVPPRMTEAVARAVIEQWLLPKPAAEG